MLTITLQIAPPLKFSGDCVMSSQISDSLSFHVSSALVGFCTTQLSDTSSTSFRGRHHACPKLLDNVS